MENGRKLFTMLLLVVVLVNATCFGRMGVAAAETSMPEVEETLTIKSSSYIITVTPSAIGIEIIEEIEPPLPGPIEELPVPPEPIYEEVPEIEMVLPTAIKSDTTKIHSTLTYEEEQDRFMETEYTRIIAWLFQNGLDHGIIEPGFRPGKRLSYGQFALMVRNALSLEGQVPDSKEARLNAINWIKEEYGISYKSSKKMTYAKASKVLSKVLGQNGSIWKESFQNLKKEAQLLLPSVSLGGDKMSQGEGLYVICLLLEADTLNNYDSSYNQD